MGESDFKFQSQIQELGPEFYDAVKPAVFPKLQLRYKNPTLTAEFQFSDEELLHHFGEFQPIAHSLVQPLALRYHGHQFQHYNPDIGDGRGFLFAQVQWQNKLWDFATKGSGQTPYSRRGDGRLTLKGAFRESLATEMLESLGVKTSRTFTYFETGEALSRNDEPSPTRGAVLTRFGHSHIRFGTFQRLAYLAKPEAMQRLLEYSCAHLLDLPKYSPPAIFLNEVLRRTAKLTAQWMMAGFVHGVLNSDNLNVTGESFDYGPFRFLPVYDPGFTAAYFDETGLYAYGQQPQAVLWDLYQLAGSVKLLDPTLNLEKLGPDFQEELHEQVRLHFLMRLNLKSRGADHDNEMTFQFFQMLETTRWPFEQTFFEFYRGRKQKPVPRPESKIFYDLWDQYEAANPAKAQDPYFDRSSPVTMLIDELEALWAPIDKFDEWSAYEKKLAEIRSYRGIYSDPALTPTN